MDVKIVPLVLAAFFTCTGWFVPIGAFDSYETVVPLSNNPEEKTAVVLKANAVILQNLPKTGDFDYIMLKLVGELGALPPKVCKNARKEVYDARFSFYGVPDGSYFIEVYTAPEKYTTYSSYINGQSIHIRIRDSKAYYVQPPTLARNVKAFGSNPCGADALAGYLAPSKNIQSDSPEIIMLADTITAGLPTQYDKAKAIHNWVCTNLWYDDDERSSGVYNEKTIMDALDSRRGVCVEYASVTAALLRAAGIPAKLVTGYALNVSSGENWTEELLAGDKRNHVWNEAFVDGRWIIMDTTYDSDNTYKNGRFSDGTGLKNRKYFDVAIEFLSSERRIVSDY